MNPEKNVPFYEDHAMLKAIYDDHWSEDNMSPNKPFLATIINLQFNTNTIHKKIGIMKNNAEIRKSTYFMRGV